MMHMYFKIHFVSFSFPPSYSGQLQLETSPECEVRTELGIALWKDSSGICS